MGIANPGSDFWAFRVSDEISTTVDGLDIPTIISRFDLDHIDLLKLDIEGSEKQLFEGKLDWLSVVRSICVETHDAIYPGSAQQITRTIVDAGFNQITSGHELLFTKPI